MRLSDEELLAIQRRATRVLSNGTTSGSARRLAEDSLHMSTILLARSRSYKVRLKRQGENQLFRDLEDQFKED